MSSSADANASYGNCGGVLGFYGPPVKGGGSYGGGQTIAYVGYGTVNPGGMTRPPANPPQQGAGQQTQSVRGAQQGGS